MYYRNDTHPRQPMKRNLMLEAIKQGPAILDRSRPLPDEIENNLEQTIRDLSALLYLDHDAQYHGEYAERIMREL